MQTQERRDEKTLTIATALGLWVCLMASAGTAIWAADSILALGDGTTSFLGVAALIGASTVSVIHLAIRSRSGRPTGHLPGSTSTNRPFGGTHGHDSSGPPR